jgi:hypothetical protein
MATVRDGGKGALVVVDAHTTSSDEAAAVVDDLNTVMHWVSYADVANTTATAEELDFTALT